MSRKSLRRGATLASAASLVLALATAGAAIGTSAGATGAAIGVTSTSVTIGATVPLSSPADVYADVSGAAAAVFAYENAHHHGVNNRTINYLRRDDCYYVFAQAGQPCNNGDVGTPGVTTALLNTSGGIFATVGSLGTTAQDSVEAALKTAGVPQTFVNSGDPSFNSPTKYPGTFGFQTSYISEGKIFGKYIKSTYPGASVGFNGQSDFGPQEYLGLKDEKITAANSSSTLYYNDLDGVTGSTTDIVADVNAIALADPKVVVIAAIPNFTKVILDQAANDHFSPHWVISSVGSDPTFVDDANEVGAVTMDFFAPTTSTTAWNTWLRKVLEQGQSYLPSGTFTSTTPITGNEQYGAAYAVAFCEALYSLGKPTAGITRAKYLAALTKVKFALNTVLPLAFTKTNHQGLLGGIIATVAAVGTNGYVTEAKTGKPIYLTTDKSTAAVTNAALTNSAIPSYLK